MAQTVTVSFVPGQVLTWIIIGLLAGLLAGLLVRGRRFGMITSVVVGLLGALVGGFLFSLLGLTAPAFLSGGLILAWSDIFISFIGAVIVLIIFGGFYRTRRRV